ncbi:sulfite exporter TauE/SafE family protein [Lutibacter sp. B2]|nr:sulfite exporter TauE/SafE family protein [Lutibacter sp. B2]
MSVIMLIDLYLRRKTLKKNKIKMFIIGTVTGFINGLLGSGGGTIIVPTMERILKIETHKAHATAIAVIFPISFISAMIYIKNQNIEWVSTGYITIGGVIGGFIGAKLLNKFSSKWLHRIFGLVMIITGVRMVFS